MSLQHSQPRSLDQPDAELAPPPAGLRDFLAIYQAEASVIRFNSSFDFVPYPCVRAAVTASAPSPASLTYTMNARDFHRPARWICSSDIPCAASCVAPPILPECNANWVRSLPEHATVILNATTASTRVTTFHPLTVRWVVSGVPPGR